MTINCVSIARAAGGVDFAKHAVKLSDTDAGPQLVASRDAPKGDNLLSVPDSMWLTPQSVASSSIGPMVQQLAPWIQVLLPPFRFDYRYVLIPRQGAAWALRVIS